MNASLKKHKSSTSLARKYRVQPQQGLVVDRKSKLFLVEAEIRGKIVRFPTGT